MNEHVPDQFPVHQRGPTATATRIGIAPPALATTTRRWHTRRMVAVWLLGVGLLVVDYCARFHTEVR
jgi:hypothetical protein